MSFLSNRQRLSIFSAILAIAVTSSGVSSADSTTKCDDLFGRIKVRIEAAYGKEYKVGLIERRGNRFGEEDPEAVFLGFNEYGHSYLSVNGLRLDGRIFGLQEVRKLSALDPGIVIRFRVDPERADEIRKVVARRNRYISLTCIRSACTALEKGGVRLPTSFRDSFFLAPSFKRILDEGVLDAKTGKPIELEVYALRDSTIEEMHEALEFRDKRMAKPYFILVKRAATATAAAAASAALTSDTEFGDEVLLYLQTNPDPASNKTDP